MKRTHASFVYYSIPTNSIICKQSLKKYIIDICTVCLALQPDMFIIAKKKKITEFILLQECAAEVCGKTFSHNLAIGFSSNLYYTLHFYSSLFYVELLI